MENLIVKWKCKPRPYQPSELLHTEEKTLQALRKKQYQVWRLVLLILPIEKSQMKSVTIQLRRKLTRR